MLPTMLYVVSGFPQRLKLQRALLEQQFFPCSISSQNEKR
jgi:hypothetical protein